MSGQETLSGNSLQTVCKHVIEICLQTVRKLFANIVSKQCFLVWTGLKSAGPWALAPCAPPLNPGLPKEMTFEEHTTVTSHLGLSKLEKGSFSRIVWLQYPWSLCRSPLTTWKLARVEHKHSGDGKVSLYSIHHRHHYFLSTFFGWLLRGACAIVLFLAGVIES